MTHEDINISVLVGKRLESIERINNEELLFITTDGERFCMCHSQDCCENVQIEDICGDLGDLIGLPIVIAEESTNSDTPIPENIDPHGWGDSFTWTFYRLATEKGWVVIRWLGTSSGYYSERVELIRR